MGSLDYQQMLTAYRAYKVFLNVNSVVDSPSMCARRIFEITACGTSVVSTPSEAVRRYFTPEQLSVVSDREHAADVVRALVRSPELAERMVHRAQREIWAKHTCTHRVETVLERAVPHLAVARTRPTVTDANVVLGRIPAVESGRMVVQTDAQEVLSLSAASPLSLPWALENVVPDIIAAAERN